VAFKTLKSTVPGHFTTLWKSRSTSTPSGQLAQDAAEYFYSARAESVNVVYHTKDTWKLNKNFACLMWPEEFDTPVIKSG
jgi:hypothetical protein